MSFTDNDLKILKSNRRYWEAKTQSEPNHLAGLIMRLEAAERVCEAAHSVALALDDHANEEQILPAVYRDELQDPLYYWRKAAGK